MNCSSISSTFFNDILAARLSSSIVMVPTTQRDAGAALEHILGILLAEPSLAHAFIDITPLHACFASKAGIALDYISMKPKVHGSISFKLSLRVVMMIINSTSSK
jgi:hypothetical protein